MATATAAAAKPAKPDAEKRVEAFRTYKTETGTPISLWIVQNDKKGAPVFDGKVGKRRVAIYIRNGKKGAFLSLVGNKDKEGKFPQLGRANVRVTEKGIPKLAIVMEGSEETLWAHINKKVPEDLLTKCGLDLDELAKKREAAEKAKAERAAAKAAKAK